jgi:hypothetical protein
VKLVHLVGFIPKKIYLLAIQLRFLGRPARDMLAIITESLLSK